MTDVTIYHEELIDVAADTDTILQKLDSLLGINTTTTESESDKNNNNTKNSSSKNAYNSSDINARYEAARQQRRAEDNVRRFAKLLHQMRIEVRLIDGGSGGAAAERRAAEAQVAMHEKRLAQFRSRLQRISSEMNERKHQMEESRMNINNNNNNNNRNALFGGDGLWSPNDQSTFDNTDGGGGGGDMFGNNNNNHNYNNFYSEEDRMNAHKQPARAVADRIGGIQQQTLESLQRTEGHVAATEETGAAATATLRAQTEQIEKTKESMGEMKETIGKSKAELRGFLKRMARDRIIIFFAVAITLCIIAIIILAVFMAKPWKHK